MIDAHMVEMVAWITGGVVCVVLIICCTICAIHENNRTHELKLRAKGECGGNCPCSKKEPNDGLHVKPLTEGKTIEAMKAHIASCPRPKSSPPAMRPTPPPGRILGEGEQPK